MALLLSGCVTLSVNPLYEPQDVVELPDLVGLWGDPEDPEGETWQFMANSDGSYRLVIREEDSLRIQPERDGLFTVHVVKLGDEYFLDFFPEEPELGSEFYKCHIVPAHSFWRMELAGHVLTLYALETSDLEKALANGTIAVDHIKRDDVMVLTASVTALQDLVQKHSAQLFHDGESLGRIQ
jgi:hypothetical protein